jgi:hypothetical protein
VGDISVKIKVLKSSTTFLTMAKFLEVIKKPKNDDEQKLLSLTELQNMHEN